MLAFMLAIMLAIMRGIMLAYELRRRGKEFSKLMALATELEDAKVKACFDLIAYIESLPANIVRNSDLRGWVLPKSMTVKLKNMRFLVNLTLCLRDDRFYFSLRRRTYWEIVSWVFHLPRSFAELAGKMLADLWRCNPDWPAAFFENLASRATLEVIDSYLQHVVKLPQLTEFEINLIADIVLAYKGNVWRNAVTAVLQLAMDPVIKAKIIYAIGDAADPSGANVLMAGSGESSAATPSPTESTASVGMTVAELGPRKRRAVAAEGEDEQRCHFRVKRPTPRLVHQYVFDNCEFHFYPGDDDTNVPGINPSDNDLSGNNLSDTGS